MSLQGSEAAAVISHYVVRPFRVVRQAKSSCCVFRYHASSYRTNFLYESVLMGDFHQRS